MNFKTILKPRKNKYPQIMIDPDSKSIYLMTDKCGGTKLVQGDTGINAEHPVGEHKDNWTSWDLVPYEGKVIFDCRI